MSVAEVCGAAIEYGDNTAADLLLEQPGGPAAVTGLCRSLGDGVTRLDRWEPELDSAEPGRVTDTTTPLAVSTTYAKPTDGHALAVGDKTGTGDYGTADGVTVAADAFGHGGAQERSQPDHSKPPCRSRNFRDGTGTVLLRSRTLV